jgi:hypothetical protein
MHFKVTMGSCKQLMRFFGKRGVEGPSLYCQSNKHLNPVRKSNVKYSVLRKLLTSSISLSNVSNPNKYTRDKKINPLRGEAGLLLLENLRQSKTSLIMNIAIYVL